MRQDSIDPLEQRLREAAWRHGKLTEAEQKEWQRWLEAHPEAQAELEAESGLTEALERLPDAPVASNFTARVLQAVESDSTREQQRRQGRAGWGWRAWWPRAAAAGVVAALGLWGMQLHRQNVHREQALHREQARSVTVIAEVTSLPAPELLQEDFEAIRALKTTPDLRSDPRKTTAAADEQLLTLLQ